MVLVGDLFDLDRRLDRANSPRGGLQDLIQTLSPLRFLFVFFRHACHWHRITLRFSAVGSELGLNLVLHDLLKGTSEGTPLDETIHGGLAVCFVDLMLLLLMLPGQSFLAACGCTEV